MVASDIVLPVQEERAPAPSFVTRWIPLGIVAIACLLPFWGLWRAPGPPMEEGFMLAFPEFVLKGLVPNRDFLHLYGPGSLWALAAIYKVLGTSVEVERAVGFSQQVAVAFGVFACLRPWNRWVAAGGGAMAAVIIVPPVGLTALAWVGGLAFGTWTVATAGSAIRDTYGTRRRTTLLIVAPLLAAAALLYRPDLVVAIGLTGIALWPALRRDERIRAVAAFATGLLPYVVHLVVADPANVIRGLVIEPVFHLRGGRKLPLPPSWGHFDGFLQQAGDLIAPRWPLPAPPSPAQLTLWILLIVAADAALLIAGLAAARRGRRSLLLMAVFATGLLPQALQRADSTHLAWVSAVPLGFLPAAVFDLVRTWRPRLRPLPTAAAAIATPVLLTLFLVPHFTWRTYGDYIAQSAGLHRDVHTIEHDGRIFYYGRLDAVEAVRALLPEIDRVARPGDRLFVGTGDLRKTAYSEAFLYYLLPDLDPGTRYVEMDPGVANADDSGLADDLRSSDIVILSSIRDDWVEPNDSASFGSDEPVRVLEREFCLHRSYGTGLYGRGLYELYLRCDRTRGL